MGVNQKIKRIIVTTITFILLVAFAHILYFKPASIITNIEVKAQTTESINIIEKLKKDYKNKDVVALLNVSNEITEPVVQSTDNKYYLNHNINKEEDKYGATYMDYRIDLDSSKKILIFGHSSTKINTSFNNLEKYYDKKYYDENQYITLTTEKEEIKYRIFSVYVETSDWTYMNLKFKTEEDWYNHLLKLKNKSSYNTGIDITKNDEILILQTCSNKEDYKKYKKKYLLIIAKKEKI